MSLFNSDAIRKALNHISDATAAIDFAWKEIHDAEFVVLYGSKIELADINKQLEYLHEEISEIYYEEGRKVVDAEFSADEQPKETIKLKRSEAPEGATHYYKFNRLFYKLSNGHAHFYSDKLCEWVPSIMSLKILNTFTNVELED